MRSYADLVNDVRSFLNRKDLEEQIPRFIMLAESDLFRRLRATCNERIVTYTEAAVGYPIIGAVRLPDSCMELKTVIWNGLPLKWVSDSEYFRRLHAEPPQSTGSSARVPAWVDQKYPWIEGEGPWRDFRFEQITDSPAYWQDPEYDFPDWLQPAPGQTLVGTGRPEVFTRIQNYLCFHPVSDVRDVTLYVSMYAFDGPLDSVNYETHTLQDAYNAYLYGALSHAEGYLMNDAKIALWKSKFEECLGQLNGTKTDAELGSVQEVMSAYA